MYLNLGWDAFIKGTLHVFINAPRRGTIDSLVRFAADSTLIGPAKEKISLWPFIFIASRLSHIFGSPTKIYRISWENQPKSSKNDMLKQ